MVPQDSHMFITWQAIGVICAVLAAVTSLATAYLRMMIKSTVNELKESIETKIEGRFAAKETIDAKLSNILTRIEHVERAVDRLEKRD